jgi:hypothetical protein
VHEPFPRPDTDTTVKRMMENYAAILTTWELLKQFAGIADGKNEENNDPGYFTEDLIGEMNEHIADTDGICLPWVWIMEILLSEIDAGRFEHPYTWDTFKHLDGHTETALYLRPGHVMDHISTAPHLRAKIDSLPIKTSKVFNNNNS